MERRSRFNKNKLTVLDSYFIKSKNIIIYSILTEFGNKFYAVEKINNSDAEIENATVLEEISNSFSSLENVVIEDEKFLSIKYNDLISEKYEIKSTQSVGKEKYYIFKVSYLMKNIDDIIKNINENGSHRSGYDCKKVEDKLVRIAEILDRQKRNIKQIYKTFREKQKTFVKEKKEKVEDFESKSLNLFYSRQKMHNLSLNITALEEIFEQIKNGEKFLKEIEHEVDRIIN